MFTHLIIDGSDGTLERNTKPRFNRNAHKRLVNDEIIMGLHEYFVEGDDDGFGPIVHAGQPCDAPFTVAAQCDTDMVA